MNNSNPFAKGDTVRIDFQSGRPGKRGPAYIKTVLEEKPDRLRTDLGWMKRLGPDYWQDSSGQLATVTLHGGLLRKSLHTFVSDVAESELV